MGMSNLPEIYVRAGGRNPSASAYISGKSQVPMLQLIYSLMCKCGKTAEILRKCIYLYGTM